MEEVAKLFDKTVIELERMLNSKTVVGEPITIEGNTLIPLVNVGFGFGVGGGREADAKKGSSQGGGTGGGGGVKPVALIIINQDGVHVEPIKSGAASALERVAETFARSASGKNDNSSA